MPNQTCGRSYARKSALNDRNSVLPNLTTFQPEYVAALQGFSLFKFRRRSRQHARTRGLGPTGKSHAESRSPRELLSPRIASFRRNYGFTGGLGAAQTPEERLVKHQNPNRKQPRQETNGHKPKKTLPRHFHRHSPKELRCPGPGACTR